MDEIITWPFERPIVACRKMTRVESPGQCEAWASCTRIQLYFDTKFCIPYRFEW